MADTTTVQPVGEVAGAQLIEVADRAILAGLRNRRPHVPGPSELHTDLHQTLGVFVTLTVREQLNGCIGSIEGDEPLAVSVARHAWSAAFADPRLPALRWSDYEHLDIEVSVLSPLSAIPSGTRTDLLGELRPGVDGLLIRAGMRRAVFLPSVWGQLPSAEAFVEHLFGKAGLAPNSWPDDLHASRFTAQKIGRVDREGEQG